MSAATLKSIVDTIANELSVTTRQVDAAVELLDEGATVPFISRYRKEVTGGLDDSQLRTLQDRLVYLREMEERRGTILNSIEEQGKLTPELKTSILSADTKTRLEDLYLPYKPKRRTKGQIAIEAGLEPLADALFNDPSLEPETEATSYLNPDHKIDDTKAALDGAKFILMERFSEDAELLGQLRQQILDQGVLNSTVAPGKEQEGSKYSDYFEHSEPLKKTPSHRALAMFRGRREGFLHIKVDLPQPENASPLVKHPCETRIASHFNIADQSRPADKWLSEVVRWTWRVKLHSHIETDLLGDLRQQAETEAITVFAENLKDLLLAAPAGLKATIALDPGLRTGVKVAVIDATGKLVDHGAIFPHAPKNQWDQSIAVLAKLAAAHSIELVAIGNGTASRETDKLAGDLIKRHPELKLQKIMVSEAGASVYSASEFAAKEFPDLDVTIRGAVSIGRRLQDPLAELVKIEPKSIGVGQYQHDVSQSQLAQSLDAVVEDCVNAVGVEVNTASAALLRRVSGLNQTIADNIVTYRDANGVFKSRKELKKVPRLGDKTFEQAAGFLRIANGDNPLDSSAVHPESYQVVERIANKQGKDVKLLLGDSATLRSLKAVDYTDDQFGIPTVTDIIKELDKPGRDPRPEFKAATFMEGVETLKDLEPGMVLEGTVTNVANFGAFVDIGVHQDGLVHISALSHSFVEDPRKVVKTGDIVKVKVMEVDIPRKRIGLSMRLDDQPGENNKRQPQSRNAGKPRQNKPQNRQQPQASGTMAALFAKAQNNKGKRL
ncbi:Tex family protein [Porticoccus sp. W117]|uniref:Tex family protein n=1 Tax=Porticoccus sp. W117 TaxID=3054777 RepID=UPI002597AD11|nr:Tex family protein [Porticoccus sp. W117]MDM3871172.1 Tex family protein [Porticoccus sp. W117]